MGLPGGFHLLGAQLQGLANVDVGAPLGRNVRAVVDILVHRNAGGGDLVVGEAVGCQEGANGLAVAVNLALHVFQPVANSAVGNVPGGDVWHHVLLGQAAHGHGPVGPARVLEAIANEIAACGKSHGNKGGGAQNDGSAVCHVRSP